MSEATAPPYPSDVRAKGWRFELDHERIRQSDTWALAPAEARPWLLMLWMVAWEQTPCGSLPADDALIAARIGMTSRLFAKHRDVLLRGWWRADDGRLYHPTITARVLEMLTKRRKEADRKALARREPQRGSGQSPADVPRDNEGTTNGLHPESDTGTSTSTRREREESIHPPVASARARDGADSDGTSGHSPTVYGSVCKALRAAGIARTNPGNLRFRALVDAGADGPEFIAYAETAKDKDDPFAYLVACVEGERKRVKVNGSAMHHGAMPNKQEALEQRNKATARRWVEGMRKEAAA